MAKVKRVKGGYDVVHGTNGRKLAGTFRKRSKAQKEALEIKKRNP